MERRSSWVRLISDMQRVHLLWIQSCDTLLRLCFLYSLLKVFTIFFYRLTNSDCGDWNWLEYDNHGLCFNSDDSYSVPVLSIRRCTQSEISVSQSKFRETSRVNSGEKWVIDFIDCIGIDSTGKHYIECILRVIKSFGDIYFELSDLSYSDLPFPTPKDDLR